MGRGAGRAPTAPAITEPGEPGRRGEEASSYPFSSQKPQSQMRLFLILVLSLLERAEINPLFWKRMGSLPQLSALQGAYRRALPSRVLVRI